MFSFDTLKSAQNEIKQLQAELENRDETANILRASFDKQRKEFLAKKAIYKWRNYLKDKKIDRFSEQLADTHYNHNLLKKTLITWNENKDLQWKERVTLNCQSKAENMCKMLSERYRKKVSFSGKSVNIFRN